MSSVEDKGGVGHSWFVVELTSSPVYDGEVSPQPSPSVPLPGSGEPIARTKYAGVRKHHLEQAGEYVVLESQSIKQAGHYNAKTRVEVAANFDIIKNNRQEVEGILALSTHMKRIRREDEEILLIT